MNTTQIQAFKAMETLAHVQGPAPTCVPHTWRCSPGCSAAASEQKDPFLSHCLLCSLFLLLWATGDQRANGGTLFYAAEPAMWSFGRSLEAAEVGEGSEVLQSPCTVRISRTGADILVFVLHVPALRGHSQCWVDPLLHAVPVARLGSADIQQGVRGSCPS